MTKPIFVYVCWSESERFPEKTLWRFERFEELAAQVAQAHRTGGYLKTNVTVIFSGGEDYVCRLDLAPHDAQGFEHHAKRFISEFDRCDDAFTKENNQPLADFLKTIDWN
ncbi:LPD25 domain-containing protein [Hyphomonas sp.]|jgi:hypothetical protein|uniref:LPD25 domain-containing protein n=1 Tax=Hyphomonas sp. TaxID=87 RepID=UPI0032F03EB7